MEQSTEKQMSKKKRTITEARRRQSREAQKRYREKQKQQWADLMSIASASPLNAVTQTKAADSTGSVQVSSTSRPQQLRDQPTTDDIPSVNETVAFDSDLFARLINVPDGVEPANNTALLGNGPLSWDSYDLQPHTDTDSPPFQSYQNLSSTHDSVIETSTYQHDLSTALTSDAPSFPQPASLTAANVPQSAPSIPADTYIRVHRDSFINVFMQNAMVLGFTYDTVTAHGCHLKSMWCPPLPQPQSHPSLQVDWKADLPSMMATAPDLAPTKSQLQFPHDIYLDIFPFAEFREKTLALRAMKPKVFDEADLKRDLDSGDAVRCWGPTPWDRRSWEVQPWFLHKWWMLTGGDQGEMGSLSRWWRRLRGEI